MPVMPPSVDLRLVALLDVGPSLSLYLEMTKENSIEETKAEPDEKTGMHNYHDYAREAEKASGSIEEPNHGDSNFPVKLHFMLSELETDGMDDIISWQPHGRCFLVHKQLDFVEKVLPL
jgi:hypothetical protein